MKHLIFIALLIVTVCSCTRKATTYTNKETVRIDTFFRYREVIKTLPQKDSIVIYNPCDSFGIINKFYAQISIPNGKVKIQSKNNNLIATVVSNQTVSVNDSTNRKQVIQEATIVEKIIVKNVIPLWIIIALLIETMIILLYLYFKIFYLK
jgi:hypothetical protein